MTHPPVFSFNAHNPVPSGSSFKTKRKRMSWVDEQEGNKQMRVRSPPLEHRSSFPLPELTMDHSNPTSDDDQGMDQDHDMDAEIDMNMAMGLSGRAHTTGHDHQHNYNFSSSGSGGFGFGPGAEEDELEMDMVDDMGASAMKAQYGVQSLPSLTPHPNPHHFSNNIPSYGLSSNQYYTSNNPNFNRASSPLAAQTFSTSLQAPTRPPGLLQPSFAAPLAANANDVDRARNAHGPHCSSIPKLVMSEHPDPSGKRSLWSVCGDCGACEMAQ